MQIEINTSDELTTRYISINKINGILNINPTNWQIEGDVIINFLMTNKTLEFIKERGIILHSNYISILSITLRESTEEDNNNNNNNNSNHKECKCFFTQTPGIFHEDYPIIETPSYQSYIEMYKGTIGQTVIRWPESIELNITKSYCLHIIYKTNNGNGIYISNNTLITLNGYYDSSSWIPCVCNSLQLVHFNFIYNVPSPYTVISTGVASIPIIEKGNRRFEYNQTIRIPIKSFGFIVTKTQLLPIESPLKIGFFSGKSEEKRSIYTYTQLVPKAIQSIKKYTSCPEPFPLSIVTVKELPHEETVSFAGLIIVSSEILYLQDNADRYRHTSYELGRIIASQWFGHYIIPKKIEDEWITVGLRDYLSEQFVKTTIGQNYTKYKAFEQQNKVLLNKWGDPIHSKERKLFGEEEINEHFRRKVDIAMGVMENHLGKERMKKLIVNKILNNGNGVEDFKRIIKTVTFVKELQTQNSSLMKQFEERLVDGTGYGKIAVGFAFTQRTIQTDFKIKQSKQEKGYNVVPVRIHEVEQTIEDSIELKGEETEKSIPCHSRIRKQRKRPIKTDTGETIIYDLDSRDCKKCGQSDTDVPILYIEIDPDNDYPRKIKRDKHSFQEYMWLTQLEFVRTIRGQLVTIEGLEKCCTEKGINALFDFLINNHRCYYKVQIEAANAIARMSCQENNYLGFNLLKQFYMLNFYEPSIGVIPLDFSNSLRYEIQKGIITALSKIKIHSINDKIIWENNILQLKIYNKNMCNTTNSSNKIYYNSLQNLPESVEFLLEIAENSTNERNKYQDGVFIKTIVNALGNINTPIKEENERIEKYIKRVLNKDKIIPSDRNIVTQKVIQIKPNFVDLFNLIAVGNYFEVRIKAIEYLLINNPSDGINQFLLIHERGDLGRIRIGICEIALTINDFPQQLIESQLYKEYGKRCYNLLCNRRDYIKNKIMLSLVFNKWFNKVFTE